jgi:hypothetical protein
LNKALETKLQTQDEKLLSQPISQTTGAPGKK